MRYPTRTKTLPVALAVAIAMFATATAAPAPAAAAQDAAHAHGHAAPPGAIAEAPAQGWATDAPLRDGMRGIGRTVQALDAGPAPLDAAVARAASASIREQVAAIVANCRLPPDADAALHPILADLARGGAALAADRGDPTAVPMMRRALADYARTFDDPGFHAP